MFSITLRELGFTIFVAASGSKMDQLVHLPPEIHTELYSIVNFTLYFISRLICGELSPFGRGQIEVRCPVYF